MKLKKAAAFLISLAAAASAMTMPVSAMQFFGGDIDGDDDVDAADAALILQYAAYVGAGGELSIFEFVEPAETPDWEVTPNTEGQVCIDGMEGKKLSEVMDAGFDVNGYMRSGQTALVYAFNYDYMDDTISSLQASVEGKTVKEMVDAYDISIGYMGFNDQYTFYTTVGTVQFQFDLAHGAEAIRNHADESFYDLEEAEEIQSDVLENIAYATATFSIEFDDASRQKILAIEDISTEKVKAIADELVVNKVYYKIK